MLLKMSDFANRLERSSNYWSPISSDTKIAYPETGSDECFQVEDKSYWFCHRSRVIMELASLFKLGSPLFDIGGGNGFQTSRLAECNMIGVLVEPSLVGVKNAVARGVENIVASTFQDAGFKKNSLPSIGLFDVLEHVENDNLFLQELYESLVPGGRIIATVPAYGFLWSDNDVYAGHFRRYVLDALADDLRIAGFKIDFASYIFSFLPPAIFAFRTVPSLLGIGRRPESEQKQKSEHGVSSGGDWSGLSSTLFWTGSLGG